MYDLQKSLLASVLEHCINNPRTLVDDEPPADPSEHAAIFTQVHTISKEGDSLIILVTASPDTFTSPDNISLTK